MKPTISIALLALGLTFPAPALAAPTHLTCTETKSTESELRSRQVFIDTDTNAATVYGQSMRLTAEPDQLILSFVQETPDFDFMQLVVNRSTLAFNYHRALRSQLARQLGEGIHEIKTGGQCRITPAPVGRQI